MTETTYNVLCIHRMPCGLCELTKEACVYGIDITTLTPVTVLYGEIEPNWDKVMCHAERGDDETN